MKRFTPPNGGQFLGGAVEVLRLRDFSGADSVLNDETTRRFFGGDQVKDETRQRIIFDVACCALRMLGLPDDPAALAAFLDEQTQRWDAFWSELRGTDVPAARPEFIVMAFLRMATVDAALRLGGAWVGSGLGPPVHDPDATRPQVPPPWASQDGLGLMLRQLIKSAGMTRDQLAEAVGVSRTSIYKWLDCSAPPGLDNLDRLARCLAEALGQPPAHIELALRLHVGLCNSLRKLASHIRDKAVDSIVHGLWRLTTRTIAYLSGASIQVDL